MMDRFHIVYTIPNFDTAGSGKVVYDLVRNLDKEKFKVSIVCKHAKGAFFQEVEKLDVAIHIMPFTVPIRPYHSLPSRTKVFRQFLKRENVDLVHSWHWSGEWSEALACKMAGVKYMYTKKSMGWQGRHWKIKSFLANYIITVNEAMASFYKRKEKFELVPFGVDTMFYKPAIKEHQFEKDDFTVITVANLVAVKNIEFLLSAIKTLEDLPITLHILGDTRSEYAQELQDIVKASHLSDRVKFLGKHEDVRPFLNKADVFVICSKKEGMPMALVEAMSMGLPVLGSDIPGISYVLKAFREYLFTLDDPQDLALKLRTMYKLEAAERQKIGAALRDYCIKELSMERFIHRHEEIYTKLIGRSQ